MNSLKLGSRIIDDNSDPYIIAEIELKMSALFQKLKS